MGRNDTPDAGQQRQDDRTAPATGAERRRRVGVGDRAPDFTLRTQTGAEFHLGEHLGQHAIVLYFYPKDDTPGCTAEACAFRDQYEVFRDAGAVVVGVSSDSGTSHRSFAERYNLPFTLLSDPHNEVRRLYGVPATLGLLPGRVTFIIDRRGIIRHTFSSQLNIQRHIQEALRTLGVLRAEAENGTIAG